MKNSSRTYLIKEKDIKKAWLLVDAKDKVLGRLACKVATVLMGKNKVIYSPHQDTGDEVIVINAKLVKTTGNKLGQKTYLRYSAYPGGLNSETLAVVIKKSPERVIIHAVHGMLPKSKLGAKLLKKLRVYPDAVHPHQAQQPKALKIA